MAKVDNQGTVSIQELIVSSLAQTDALCKLLIEKGLISEAEFMEKRSGERRVVRRCFKSVTSLTKRD